MTTFYTKRHYEIHFFFFFYFSKFFQQMISRKTKKLHIKMYKYSIESIIFISISIVNILSLLILMLVILKSPSYLTKWTLFQLCIAALGYSISTLPSILLYGDNLLDKAFTTSLCKIQFRVASFFFYPLNLLPIELSFYFYGLLKQKLDLDIEKKWFWTLTSIIWIVSLFYNSLILSVSRDDENGGIMVTKLYCEAYKVTNNWNHYWVYQFIVTIFLVAIIISCEFSVFFFFFANFSFISRNFLY
jgi:hypothetical protein